ncbi:hypothetical protein F4553_005359 [Allocatelliglobosispora scoriae]|uniref:Uncharacterized protein n=1 Tax=Allocatelliglobosispora scoriae TaxID=643052 RepID=A0A841BZ34_9ACTN|nr:hypothetical protein [Allocatelliglobosispora scoriae]MBB5871980.1 hypothetical protein [Allocatelliglobosispora scoriae]
MNRHPHWCQKGHHCTTERHTTGEHASAPECWSTSFGRLVATRYQQADTGRTRLEIRVVVHLTGTEQRIQESARVAIATVYAALTHRAGTGATHDH